MTSKADDIPVLALGEFASDILAANEQGHVLAVFRRSFYIRFGDDVVCFGPCGLGRGPLNALCILPESLFWVEQGLLTESVARRTESMLCVGRFSFDFKAADIWSPPPAGVVASDALALGLRLLADAARRRALGGLGALVSELCDASVRESPPDEIDPLLQAARPSIAAITTWLSDALAGSPALAPNVDALIGLGPGLTPSGDDFLCGAMAALHYFGCADLARHLADQVLPKAGGTNVISAAYLRCAAAGQASALLFDALQNVLAGRKVELESAITALQAIGHTSGPDSLAGAAAIGGVLQNAHARAAARRSAQIL